MPGFALLSGCINAASRLATAQSSTRFSQGRFVCRHIGVMPVGLIPVIARPKLANNHHQDQLNSAEKHFNTALRGFDESFEYFAKASLAADDEPARENLKPGGSELEKCVKALERNDLDQAQTDYDNAQLHFSLAAMLLD